MRLWDVNTKEKWMAATTGLSKLGVVWATDFPQHIPTFEEAKSWYHGNSKLLLHLFYNDITNRYEMNVTTKSVLMTYPQYKAIVSLGYGEYELIRR